MTAPGLDWFARRPPRLAAVVVIGALLVAAGAGLAILGRDPLGTRLTILGAIVLLFGASGYLAFAAFGRGVD